MTGGSRRFTESTQGRLRRLNLVTSLPPVVFAAVALVYLDARVWWHVVVLVPGAVAAVVAFERWTANDLARFALPCVVVAAAVWPLGALVTGSPNAYWGICAVGSLVLREVPRWWRQAAAGLFAYVALVGAARLLVPHDGVRQTLVNYVLIPTLLTVLVTVATVLGERFFDLIRELEQTRESEAELAVVRERVRFASDLHDIQGHTLHVVKLKIALARKLLDSDTARADKELRETYALVSGTIAETKELAHAQRRLNLTAEIENAKNLFEAAGIRVRVSREAEVDARAGELLGQVLRETTTNILRHAQATQVRITLGESGITIVNDGVTTAVLPELRGLAALRQRVADDGGELTVEQRDGRFWTAAVLPPSRDGGVGSTSGEGVR
ncbi:sensor histidine kinase [Micromonospora yangpuensis]|uniref:Two-component system, NarL family, sensor histidine kinase DesK n=1 Tax=Micromonospora yangpuensis TaxID=683228 RepID=A0A1C6ULD6_9ACTN|nr:histidine kinase [Micromonospora yangpuensis]GGM17402.1 histidine kinase [Micromonospora yangpuensis]SCL54679.1 two-component system, NarL family, sensor histidine kinase DesK [Micromonospora yangpuensis]